MISWNNCKDFVSYGSWNARKNRSILASRYFCTFSAILSDFPTRPLLIIWCKILGPRCIDKICSLFFRSLYDSPIITSNSIELWILRFPILFSMIIFLNFFVQCWIFFWGQVWGFPDICIYSGYGQCILALCSYCYRDCFIINYWIW